MKFLIRTIIRLLPLFIVALGAWWIYLGFHLIAFQNELAELKKETTSSLIANSTSVMELPFLPYISFIIGAFFILYGLKKLIETNIKLSLL